MTEIEERVVLVDERGDPIGEQAKSAVHHATTPLHLAFSLYLFDDDGALLMTRRALGKLTWPGVWTNSCCGHPMPGESMTDAIERRTGLELGLQVTGLRAVLPDFSYRVKDVSGIWENEICPVFVGTTAGRRAQSMSAHGGRVAVDPNPSEVMDWAWTDFADVAGSMATTPFAFSPWAVQQVAQMVEAGLVPAFGALAEGLR